MEVQDRDHELHKSRGSKLIVSQKVVEHRRIINKLAPNCLSSRLSFFEQKSTHKKKKHDFLSINQPPEESWSLKKRDFEDPDHRYRGSKNLPFGGCFNDSLGREVSWVETSPEIVGVQTNAGLAPLAQCPGYSRCGQQTIKTNQLHPGKSTWKHPKKWRWGRWFSDFQLDEFI